MHYGLQADRLFHESYALDVAVEWPQIDAQIQSGLGLVANDPYYVDSAGILVMRRFHEAPSRALYDRAAALFERAHAAESVRSIHPAESSRARDRGAHEQDDRTLRCR